MRSRYRVNEPEKAHFITSTTVDWLPVFTTKDTCDILITSLEYCREQKGLKIHGWVILDNHLHAFVSGPELAKTIGELKSFTARELLKHWENAHCDWALHQFAYRKLKHKVDSRWQVWQEGVHPQAIFDDEMMLQKLEYMHNNPVKRGLVAAPEHWRYSSAHEWLPGAEPVLRCDPWR